MHPFSSLTIFIFVLGYITARWDLLLRLYELSLFAWDHGVVVRMHVKSTSCSKTHPWQTRAAQAFTVLTLIFISLAIPIERLAAHEAKLHPRSIAHGISAHEQLRRRGSF